jgi:hypothetical protein
MKRGSGVFYMVHFEHPKKTIKNITESISFFVQPDGTLCVDEMHRGSTPDTFKLCTLDYDPQGKGERAVLLELRCSYVHNEFDEPFFWDVEGMFSASLPSPSGGDSDSPAPRSGAGESHHPDHTGKTCVVIPGERYQGPIPESNRTVYKPRLKHLDINLLSYVGLETQILNANSTCISEQGTLHEYHAFNQTDPFLVFLLQHKNRFDEVNAADIKMVIGANSKHAYYLVKRPLVKRVQSFFKTLYSLILYTQRPAIEFRWRAKPCCSPRPEAGGSNTPRGRFVTAIIQADYVVLSPEMLTYKAQGEKLDI